MSGATGQQDFEQQLAEVQRRQDALGDLYPHTADYAARMSKLAAMTGDEDTARFYADLAKKRTRHE